MWSRVACATAPCSFPERKSTRKKAAFPPVGYVSGPGKDKRKIALTMRTTTLATSCCSAPRRVRQTAKLWSISAMRSSRSSIRSRATRGSSEAFLALFSSDAAQLAKTAEKKGLDPSSALEPWTLGNAEVFARLPKGAVENALAYRKETIRRLDAFFAAYDAWLTPMVDRAPPKLGALAPTVPYDTLRQRSASYAS